MQSILFELPTGSGKTKRALDYCTQNNMKRPLIVLPKTALVGNWNNEIKKWNYDNIIHPTYIMYASFIKEHKILEALQRCDCVIFDECHHISDRCKAIIDTNIELQENIILLSATVNFELKQYFRNTFKGLQHVHSRLSDNINNGRLPKPTIVLVPMELNKEQKIEYSKRQEELDELKPYIDYNQFVKVKYLRKCLERNIWLSDCKTYLIKQLLYIYRNYRVLTFCNSIEHCEQLGSNAITSKNKKEALKIIDRFNAKKLRHITSCDILSEGMNLSDCQIGIFAMLNGSSIKIIQKCGRLLRHPTPFIIIPYYVNTRDESLANKLLNVFGKDSAYFRNVKEYKINERYEAELKRSRN